MTALHECKSCCCTVLQAAYKSYGVTSKASEVLLLFPIMQSMHLICILSVALNEASGHILVSFSFLDHPLHNYWQPCCVSFWYHFIYRPGFSFYSNMSRFNELWIKPHNSFYFYYPSPLPALLSQDPAPLLKLCNPFHLWGLRSPKQFGSFSIP